MATSSDAGSANFNHMHFEASKKGYCSMKADAGVTLVKVTGKILGAAETVEGEDQPMAEQEMQDTDQVMQDTDQVMQVPDQEMQDPDQEMQVPDQEIQDENCPKRKLYMGSHAMGPTTLKCLTYKVKETDQQLWRTFCLLRNIRHPAIATLQVFHEASGEAMVVLSDLDGMLRDLAKSGYGNFFEKKNGVTSLTTWFRSAVTEVCRGMEHLFENNVYPLDITLDDLYFCKLGPVRKCIKLLILNAKHMIGLKADSNMAKLWTQVQLLIEEIRQITGSDALSKVAQGFVNYIGKDVKMLKNYPDLWTPAQKGQYLLSIISVDKASVIASLKNSRLRWAVDNKTNNLPRVLRLLLDYDRTRPKPSAYLLSEPYDYLRLCRTVYKHFPTMCIKVPHLKEVCTTPEDFIGKMEFWEPEIWCILYEAIGLLKDHVPQQNLVTITPSRNEDLVLVKFRRGENLTKTKQPQSGWMHNLETTYEVLLTEEYYQFSWDLVLMRENRRETCSLPRYSVFLQKRYSTCNIY